VKAGFTDLGVNFMFTHDGIQSGRVLMVLFARFKILG
jgi:hypothetical protein